MPRRRRHRTDSSDRSEYYDEDEDRRHRDDYSDEEESEEEWSSNDEHDDDDEDDDDDDEEEESESMADDDSASRSDSRESYSDSSSSGAGSESSASYCTGGYHPLKPGDRLDSFLIEDKLGFGQFSTVWKAAFEVHKRPAGRAPKGKKWCSVKGEWVDESEAAEERATSMKDGEVVAIKVTKSDPDFRPMIDDEIKIVQSLSHDNIMKLRDSFVFDGPNGTHVGIVLEYLESDLFGFIKLYENQDIKMPMDIVKTVAKQLLQGIAYLAEQKIVHCDLKPENILLAKTFESVDDVTSEAICIKIGDFGTAFREGGRAREYGHTTTYRSPELIFHKKVGPATDVWTVATIIFELVAMEYMFEPRSSTCYEEDSDDSSFGSSESNEGLNHEQLCLMEELLGAFPRTIARENRQYFNARGRLRGESKIKKLPIATLLRRYHEVNRGVAERFEDFLTPMMLYNPKRRSTAAKALEHEWFEFDEEQGDSFDAAYDDADAKRKEKETEKKKKKEKEQEKVASSAETSIDQEVGGEGEGDGEGSGGSGEATTSKSPTNATTQGGDLDIEEGEIVEDGEEKAEEEAEEEGQEEDTSQRSGVAKGNATGKKKKKPLRAAVGPKKRRKARAARK